MGSVQQTPVTKEVVLKDKTKNQINVIYPYKTQYGGWSFDDEEVGLNGEPFVSGIPEIIDSLVGDAKRFEAAISKDPIKDYTCQLVRDTEGQGDYTMKETGAKGWLCPATLKYFTEYPENIYVKIKAL